jgi:N-acetylmuramoyl-L-alanine amidase
MTEQFIEQIASFVMKYAPRYGIMVHSPIIAQAILESARGTSELAVKAHNYFGLKYKAGRCPSASSVYYKQGSEQNADGTYTVSAMQWCKFDDMEDCVIGYFDFINNGRYANLKGVTDPQLYLERIKADGYATSLKYVENLLKVIETYNLTQYDGKAVKEMPLKIAIDAGHGMGTAGKRITLAGYADTREWWLNNLIADRLELMLEEYDCDFFRVDDTTGEKDIPLADRVKEANNAKADVYISIHHNAGVNGGTGGGTVVYYCSSKAERATQAKALYNAIVAKTGLVGNRSTKVENKGFYVIKNTSMPAFLIENGFMDSKTDVPIIITEEHAEKTAQGILAFLVEQFTLTKKNASEGHTEAQKGTLYRVQVGAYSVKANAEAMQKKLKASGFDAIIVETN